MSILNRDVVNKLKSTPLGNNQTLFSKICDPFLIQSKQHIEEIESGLKSNDLGLIFNASHSMKSASATLGALDFSDICSKIELASHEKHQDIAVIKIILPNLKSSFIELENALKKELEIDE